IGTCRHFQGGTKMPLKSSAIGARNRADEQLLRKQSRYAEDERWPRHRTIIAGPWNAWTWRKPLRIQAAGRADPHGGALGEIGRWCRGDAITASGLRARRPTGVTCLRFR